FTRKSLGTYKQLLSIFITYDVCLTILHQFEKPQAICIGTTFSYMSNYPDKSITALYSAGFSVPFALMIIHFLYRFWSIRYPHLIQLFSNKKFIALVAAFPISEFIIWYHLLLYGTTDSENARLAKELSERYGRNQTEGWIVMAHWVNGEFQPKMFFSLLFFDAIIFGAFTLSSTFGILSYYHIKRSDKMSEFSQNLQYKLLLAVCGQTAVPLLFVYIPYFCILNFPFFNIPIVLIDDVCATMISCFPLWDAVIIMILMRDYRDGLLGMVRRKKAPEATTVWKTVSTAKHSGMSSVVHHSEASAKY
ncbi:hypothetical protein PMAYCL1PPCAC_32461, partial [Pristionchus mayeri]